jgi:hypothetical protein
MPARWDPGRNESGESRDKTSMSKEGEIGI